jgi:hypothetical protein
MLILRLTSDPSLHGLETDDGFTIGIVSTETLFLVILTTVLGALGALVYLAVRRWLPERVRPWLAATTAGIVGGAAAIRPGGIDFTQLDPLGLAIVMFIALPAVYGVALSLLVERSLETRSGGARRRSWIAAIPLVLPLALLGPLGVFGCATVLVALVWRPSPRIASLWRSPPVLWIGRAAICAVTAAFLVELASDVVETL